jgi:hypothetical protein
MSIYGERTSRMKLHDIGVWGKNLLKRKPKGESMSLSPQTVSKVLKKAGFTLCSDRMHEGTHVSRHPLPDKVNVSIQNDSERTARGLAIVAAKVLRTAGYTVTEIDNALVVSKAEVTA